VVHYAVAEPIFPATATRFPTTGQHRYKWS